MKLVSHEEAKELMTETREWSSNHTMFSSSRGGSALAAAEFFLNRQGKTLYPYIAAKSETQDENRT
jgi:hypothetical protein